MQVPFVGPSYDLKVRKADVQRSVNMMPTPIESGTGKAKVFLKPVPGLREFSAGDGDVCNQSVPDSAVFSLLRFDEFPLVESVLATSMVEVVETPYEPAEPSAVALLIRCSNGALDCVRANNGPIVTSYRDGYEPSLNLAEDGFTIEMFLYREGGDAYDTPIDGRDSWEWSGTVQFVHEDTLDASTFNWWWHGGENWGGTSYIGHLIQDGYPSGTREEALSMPDGVWTHVAFVVDSDEVRCYVGGTLIYTEVIVDGPITTSYKFAYSRFDVYYGEPHVRAADEYRLTGRVLYTGSSFVAPTIAFPDPNPV
jgi:hypothetical protein